MASYRQYCPIARATEILAERWSLLIVRNLMFGATTFSSIAQGVPTMSRSMLTKRLRELERAGVVVSTAKPNGQGSNYSLGRWAETWVALLPVHCDPGFALWAWCRVQLNREALPAGRVVVSFQFPDERVGNRFFWLLVQDAAAEVCASDPGGEPDIRVVARSGPFVDWHRGVLTWSKAVSGGDITITGNRSLIQAFPSWNTRTPILA